MLNKSKILAQPSKPIDIAQQMQDATETSVKTAQQNSLLDRADVPVAGTITAGTWVAELDKANIRKNTLRLGE